jgi:Uma2 family endonuclease
MRLVFVKESELDHAGGAMTTDIFSDGRPMTEAEFSALGHTPERIELFDGSLHVTPAPTLRHQTISRRLANALDGGAYAAGLRVFEAVNVRLRPGRIPIPDVVIASADIKLDELIIDAAETSLVCEILSPSSSVTDKVLKAHYYAVAGIPWYLLVDPDTGVFRLHELANGTYCEHSVAKVGEVLRLTEPVVATIDPAKLLPPR